MIIKVLLNNNAIGVIQSFSFLETHHDETFRGQRLTVSRMILNKMQMEELFSRGYPHQAAQKVPVQIVVEEDNREIIRIHNAWILGDEFHLKNGYPQIADQNRGFTTFVSDDFVILEGITMGIEYISGTFPGN